LCLLALLQDWTRRLRGMEGAIIALVTWLGDKILGQVMGRSRVRLSIRTLAHPRDMSFTNDPTLRDVVVRAVNVGRTPLQIETLAIELDDRTEVTLGGRRSATIPSPGYLERSASRQVLAASVGTHRVARLVAVQTDGVRHRSRLRKEWQRPGTWPA
jgi:hypothetical protein